MVASPENQNNPKVSGEESSSSSISKYLANVQLLVTIAIAIGSFWVSSKVDTAKAEIEKTKTEIDKANQKLNEITTRFEKNKKFSDEISKTIDELSAGKSTKAKMTLVRLYTLAEDPKEKYVLVNLASASDRAELIETVASLLEGENPEGLKEDVFTKYPILAAAKAKVARKIDRTSPATEQELNSSQSLDSQNDIKPLLKAEANLLSQLTSENLTGWVFLGRENRETKKFESNVISPADQQPISNQPVTLMQSANIRQKRPPQYYTLDNLPRLVGALRRGSVIKVIDVSRVFSKAGHVGVWARIEVTRKT